MTTTIASPLPAERTQAPVIVLDALEHTPFRLSPESGYQIVEHPAIKEVLLFHGDSYCGEFDSVAAAQAHITRQEEAQRAATKRQPDAPRY